MKELTEIDRLDSLARAEVTGILLSRARLPLIIVTAFVVALAVFAGASSDEMVAVRVLAVLLVLTTILVWQSSRYALLALAVLSFAFLVGIWLPFDDPDLHTLLGSTTRYVCSVMFAFAGYRWWTNGMPFIAARSKELDQERSQVRAWINELKGSEQTDRVVQFSTGSFWTGYWTYRLLKTRSFWVIARFKRAKTSRLMACQVLELGAVHIDDANAGKVDIQMGNRSISRIDLSRDVHERLLRLASEG